MFRPQVSIIYRHGKNFLPSAQKQQKQQKWANRGDGKQNAPSATLPTVNKMHRIYISTIHSLKPVFNKNNIRCYSGVLIDRE